ncbi:MAG: FAD-dependent oxidoreductase [Candidatus Eisenbacteria bacterium]|nr:FAD-dependent oxidoreductase [Candidatus Eisenbacteria bacterium]
MVGGGFFGSSLAIHFKEELGLRPVVIEREPDLLQRASYVNQARVHNGYHYPRSLLTALRCRVNFPRFVRDYPECIVSDFEKYYAIGRVFSKVTAEQFRRFISRIGSPIEPAEPEIARLFNPDLVEAVYSVKEYAFDPVILKNITREKLDAAGIEIRFETEAVRVEREDAGTLAVTTRGPEGEDRITAPSVQNCTYSGLNRLLSRSGLPNIYLKHELTEMALVEMPDELQGLSVTMMCGPFFSFMPFPPLGLYTLSHVRYTPHCEWYDHTGGKASDPYAYFDEVPKRSFGVHMIRDASRYIPSLAGCRQVDSLWEVKTVLPRSEVDDSRPVLYVTDWGLQNLTCLMGGKIDNIYDIIGFETERFKRTGVV